MSVTVTNNSLFAFHRSNSVCGNNTIGSAPCYARFIHPVETIKRSFMSNIRPADTKKLST